MLRFQSHNETIVRSSPHLGISIPDQLNGCSWQSNAWANTPLQGVRYPALLQNVKARRALLAYRDKQAYHGKEAYRGREAYHGKEDHVAIFCFWLMGK